MYSKLVLRNFLSWEDLSFDFPKGVTLIEGFNYDDNSPEGCGKSAILNGLTWVLYGNIPKNTKVHQIIREGSKKAEGALQFETGHIIKRTRGKSTGTLELLLPDGTPYLGKDVKETQKYIDALMGMTYETFLQSVYFAQNYNVKFITSDEISRVKVLSDIADLTVFDKAIKEVTGMTKLEKDAKKELESELNTAKYKVEEKQSLVLLTQRYKTEAEEEKASKVAAITAKFEKKAAECEELTQFLQENTVPVLEEYLGATETEIKSNEAKIEKLTKELGSIDNLKEQKDILANNRKAHIQSIVETEKDVTKAEGQIQQLEIDLEAVDDKALAKANTFEKVINVIKQRIQKLQNPEDPKCPTCGTELEALEEGHFQEEIDNLNNEITERQEEIKENFVAAKQEKEKIKARAAELVESLEGYDKLIEKYKVKLDETEAKLKALKIPDLSDTEKALEEAHEQRSSLNSSFYDIKTKISDVKRTEKDLEKAGEELAGLNSEVEQAELIKFDKYDKDLKQAENGVETARKQVVSLENLLKDKEKALKDLAALKEGFKETKAYTFKALLRDLTNKSNYYLAQLFDLPINIEFTNETEAGGISKITDVVTIGETERPFSLYSGGQSRRIQLAVDLALSDIVASRGDKPIGLLIMDEYCKDLSENSMEKVLELFEGLDTSVLMIEHNSIIKNVVSNTFQIELRDGVSRCL